MDLISVIITIAVVGVILWLVNTYVPMPAPIKTVLNIVVCLVLCLWLLRVFGVVSSVHIP